MKACKKCGGVAAIYQIRELAEVTEIGGDEKKTISGKVSYGVKCKGCGTWIVGDIKEVLENRWNAIN